MDSIRLLNLGRIAPWQTQAVYHLLAQRMTADEPDTIILCRPSAPYLCLGYHQILQSIFDRTECQQRGLPVFRRRLGGGATYLDSNQLFYQCIFHHSRMPTMLKEIYASTLAAPVNTLKQLGLNAELRETNEIEVDGKRIAGTGGGRIEEACVVVGNLLFDFDFDAMTAVWKTPSESFRNLAAQALRQQIITLNQLSIPQSCDEVTEILIDSFKKCLGRSMRVDTLTAEELREAEDVASELSSEEFLSLQRGIDGSEPIQSLKISARAFIHSADVQVGGYQIHGSFWVNDNVIHRSKLESQPSRDWRQLEQCLTDVPFKEWQTQVHSIVDSETVLL